MSKNNNRLRIKVCGLRDPDNIREVLKLKPEFIGFILHPGSRRYLGIDYRLEVDIPDHTKRVGVFVNSLIDEVVHWINRLDLDMVQLHGQEGPEYCREIKQMGIKVIKAFGIDASFEFDSLKKYASWCDFFMFDAKSELHGGSGQKFNWKILDNYVLDLPVFLSGGITADDAGTISALQKDWLYAVDINSKFETAPALKDPKLLQSFFSQIRSK